MGLFSSKSKTEGSSKTKPWDPTWLPLVRATGDITEAQKEPFEFFPGQTYAPQTEAEQQAIEQLKAAAGGYGGAIERFLGPAESAYSYALGQPQRVMDMDLQNVAANPALAGVAEAIQSRVNRNLQENILPTLRTPGQMGGTRAGVAQGIASRGTSDVLSEQLANLYGGAWRAGLGAETARLGQGLSAQSGAMARAPALANLGTTALTAPAGLMLQAGALERSEAQRSIDEAMARHRFEQMEPWERSRLTMNTLMPAATAFGESEYQERGRSTPSAFQQIGGAIGLGSSLFGMGGQIFGGGVSGPDAFMGTDAFGYSPFGMSPGSYYDPFGTGFGGTLDPWTGTLLPY